MATLRAAAAPAPSIFRFASHPPPARRCTHCLQPQRSPFSSARPARQAPKRPLMTDSAQRPHSLEPAPLPPRNTGATKSSESSSSGQSWPPAIPWERRSGDRAAANAKEGEGEGEGETKAKAKAKAEESTPTSTPPTTLAHPPPTPHQTPAPTTPTPTTTTPNPTPTPPTKPPSKLRPRKAPLTLTPPALAHLHALFTAPTSKLIRIGVKNRGCSGLSYHLEYVDAPSTFDEVVTQSGVTVLIDSKALFSIIGSEMDWVEGDLEERFVFRNPNVTGGCGCGESFSVS
ncbi:hypothetical protein LTR08_004309 [Meristemomyces frigidus]|nr:hypothetical protein LTR08_004309 [Meristemomyces frigidus]